MPGPTPQQGRPGGGADAARAAASSTTARAAEPSAAARAASRPATARIAAQVATAVVAVSVLTAATATATPAPTGDDPGRGTTAARGYDQPYTGFAPTGTVLRVADPSEVGLPREPIEAALDAIRAMEEAPQAGAKQPLFPGAVALLGHRGRIVAQQASGDAVRYSDAATLLPEDERVPTRLDTIYDMASVTKVFTSILVMQQVERGALDLDAPVARYLPEFAAHGKQAVTVRQLLTHTSGFEPFIPLYSRFPDEAARIAGVLAHPLVHPPGTTYAYSDLNLITLGVLLERQTGTPLDRLVRMRITAPLRMRDTGYNPPDSKRERVAATEFDTTLGRGMVRGVVHDENAASLHGVAGHAGIFSTATDMAVLAQTLLDGGTYRGARILRTATVRDMLVDQNPQFPGDAHGLGVELDQPWYMGGLSAPRTAGHTGFTGTSMVLDPASRSFAVLLTNRVHPTRTNGTINPARRLLTSGLAEALPVRPRVGTTAWRAGQADATNATLTLALDVPRQGARLRFQTFVANAPEDPFVLESSSDGGATWEPLPADLTRAGEQVHVTGDLGSQRGTRRWQPVAAELPPGAQLVRWRHTTDAATRGRGVYVDDIRVVSGRATLLDAERRPAALAAQGWVEANR